MAAQQLRQQHQPPTLPNKLINTITSHTGPINTIAFSNLGGTYILTGSSDRSIHLSRTEPSSKSSSTPAASAVSSTPIQKYTSHGYAVLSLSVNHGNTHFASSGGDRSVFYWDIQSPQSTVRRFGNNTTQTHTSRINCVRFCGVEGSVLASGSDDRSVRLWDVKSRDTRPIQVLEDAKDGISSLVVWDSEILAGSVDGRLRTYDVRTGRVVVDVQAGPVTNLDLTKDGKVVLVGCLDGRIRMMDRRDGAMLRCFPPSEKNGDNDSKGKGDEDDSGYVNENLRLQSCFGAGETLVLSGSEADGQVRAWDVVSGNLVGRMPVGENGKVVSVVKWREGSKSQTRKDVWAAGGADGIVKLYSS